jgi:hypothetical protein
VLAAATGAVGLGNYGGDFDVELGEEVDEGGDGEVRGAAEEDAQLIHAMSADAGDSIRGFDRKDMLENPERHEKCAERQESRDTNGNERLPFRDTG